DRKQMVHPDYILAPEAQDSLPLLEPVYRLTAGLSGKILGRAVRQALERTPAFPEWQDPAWVSRRGWPDFRGALEALHTRREAGFLSAGAAPWMRLAYDELLAGQLALALVRQTLKSRPGRSVGGDGRIRARIADALPFTLTASQRQAVAEIAADFAAP